MKTKDGRLKPKFIVSASVAIGAICSFLAGELTGTLLGAIACIAMDSGTAAAGWLVAHFALKRMAA
jgi:heme/copper-type cytochrome/quinol oxidase subunit 1